MKTTIAALAALSFACAAAPLAKAAPQPAPLKHYVFMVLTNPKPGQEAEYNRWYTHTHLQDLVRAPGIVSAQRFVVTPGDAGKTPYKYLAIYEVETADLAATQKAMKALVGTPQMFISPALDKNASAVYYEELTKKVRKSPGARE
jgi:hypothetical protein